MCAINFLVVCVLTQLTQLYSDEATIRLLKNSQVVSELELSAKQISSIDLAQRGISARENLSGRLNAILTQTQLKRLNELRFHFEIADVGIAESILEQQLGVSIGITPSEKSELRRQFIEIERLLKEDIRNLHSSAFERILNELSPEQSNRAKVLIGDYFAFVDSECQRYRENPKTNRMPSYDTASGRLVLLQKSSICKELQLSKEQHLALANMQSQRGAYLLGLAKNGGLGREAARNFVLADAGEMDEILLPQQSARLMQIINQLEIAFLGFEAALVDGKLGQDIGIFENQKTAISTRGRKTVDETTRLELRAYQDRLNEAFSLLGEDRKVKSRELVGKAFLFIDYELIQKREMADRVRQ